MTHLRLRNLRRAIISFLWVVMAYALYSICIVPWIESGRARDASVAGDAMSVFAERSTDRYVRELQPLFPAGSWELDEPKVLRSQRATVLLRDYQMLKDGSLKIEPCTVIFYGSERDASAAASRGPTIMQAPEGAILAFDRPLDLQRAEIGKPVQGRLLGEIRIFSAGRPGRSEDLEIVTSNVEINQRRILTPDHVRFRIGASHGKGRDLMLTLTESTPVKPTDDQWLGGLDLIELQELEELTLQMAGEDLFQTLNQQRAGSAPRRRLADTSTVEVRCDGPMRFDLRHLIAVVEQNVRMSRQQVGKPKDTLNAERLTMHLARVRKKAKDGKPKQSRDRSEEERSLAVTRIVATGNPLVINAPSESTYIESQRLEYNFETGQIRLKGWSPFAAPPVDASGQVIFRNQQHAVVAPSIDFLGGNDRAAWRMSTGGPGAYRGTPTSDTQVLVEARWQKSMSLQPDEEQQVLRIQGSADVRASKFGSVEAETVELWLRHDTVASASSSGDRAPVETRPIPTHLVAKAAAGGSARIESAQLSGELQQMTVVFTSGVAAATARPQPAHPFTSRQSSGSVAAQDPRSGRSHFRIAGEKLTTWIDLDRQEVQRLKMDGRSRLTEVVAAGSGNEPVDIVGNAIDYQLDVQGRPAARIQGTPAIFQAAGMELQGASIHLRGSDNRVWVPGPGSMRLPVPHQLAAQPVAQRANAPLAERISVSWQGDLNFDGRTALFQDRVTAEGTDVDFHSAILRVTLDRHIDFANLSARAAPEITEMHADGGVFIARRSRDSFGTIKSVQQISTPNLRLDYATGNIVAQGAGWIAMTSLDSAMPLSPLRPQDMGGAPRTGDDRLMQLSLMFRQRLQGNIWQREVHLYDDIHGWFGPVDSWYGRVDPLQVDILGPDDIRLTCHELFVLESPTAALAGKARRPLELLARGDTYVESHAYAARGHHIKYAEEKDMLTLEGDQHRAAEIWRRNPEGGPPSSSGRFRMIRYWPRSQQLEMNGGLGAESDLSRLPDVTR